MILGFHTPRSVAEALALQAALGEHAFFLGGGCELNQPGFPGHPEHLVSLDALGLDRLQVVPGGVEIGATCTLQRVLDHPEVPAPLREAVGHVCNRNVRNMATIGGHVAMGRSCANAVPALGVLEAVLVIARPDGCTVEVPVLEWIRGRRADLVLGVRVPLPPPGRRVRVARFARTANDVAVAVVAVALDREDDAVWRPLVAVGGGGPTPMRLEALETSLQGRPPPEAAVLEGAVAALVHPVDDVRGSAAWKRRVLAVLTARVLDAAWRDGEVA